MKPGFRERLAAVPWANFQTAYGNAASDHAFETADRRPAGRWGSIAEQLTALASTDHAIAMQASHHLWCSLCHQHAYVSSAALPALPFLLEVLDDADDKLAVEILDILTGFATCSHETAAGPSWILELREQLVAQRARLQALARHRDDEVASWARRVLEELDLALTP
jgi:hypothetical protein